MLTKEKKLPGGGRDGKSPAAAGPDLAVDAREGCMILEKEAVSGFRRRVAEYSRRLAKMRKNEK